MVAPSSQTAPLGRVISTLDSFLRLLSDIESYKRINLDCCVTLVISSPLLKVQILRHWNPIQLTAWTWNMKLRLAKIAWWWPRGMSRSRLESDAGTSGNRCHKQVRYQVDFIIMGTRPRLSREWRGETRSLMMTASSGYLCWGIYLILTNQLFDCITQKPGHLFCILS